jgi:hypothetical protein
MASQLELFSTGSWGQSWNWPKVRLIDGVTARAVQHWELGSELELRLVDGVTARTGLK